ncbi:MAG TPA: TetR/AcrR family transcriptional regulator [Holophagaceae bacterium]|nr:TetR/AcrR family transcriptional regulator [Holophagaceae bacterium]
MKPPRPPAPKDRPRGPKPCRVEPDRILDAAAEIFSLEGLRGASLRAIAQRAGCDPALIYYHFDSKEAVFLALMDRWIPALQEDLTRLVDPSDTRPMSLRLWEVLRIYRRHMAHHAGLRAVVRGEVVRGAEGLQEQVAGRIRNIATKVWTLLAQGVDRGELRPDLHPQLSTFFLIRMFLEIHDWMPTFGLRVTGMPSEGAIPMAERTWFELFWRGIAADPTQPLPELPPFSEN